MPFAVNTMCLGGRYTLITKLGAGGQGEVWRVRDHARGDEIALKILNPDLARSPTAWAALQREHAIVTRLKHPLILKVFAPERDEEIVALPMELAAGGDLRRLRGVSYLEIGPVLLEVAEALAHAHALGIVHRDLKPENVLFDSRGHVRLADFGAAGILAGASSALAMRSDPAAPHPHGVGVSPFTASPEQLRGEPPAVSDDIYGLGALAYELLSGRPPYYPRFELEKAIEEPVPPVQPAHQTPARLRTLVTSMLAKPARRRPASMRDVIEALDATLNDTLTFETAPTFAAPSPVPDAAREGQAAPVCDDRDRAAPAILPAATTWLPPAVEQRPDAAAQAVVVPEPAAKPEPVVEPEPQFTSEPQFVPEPRFAPEPRRVVPETASREAMASARLPEPWRRAIESTARPPAPARTPRPSEGDEIRARAAAARQSTPPAPVRVAEPAQPAPPAHARPQPEQDLRSVWADIKVERMPNLMRLEPVRASRWPWVLLVGLAAGVALVLFSMPRDAAGDGSVLRWPSEADLRGAMKNIEDASLRVVAGIASLRSSAAGSSGGERRTLEPPIPAAAGAGVAHAMSPATNQMATAGGASAASLDAPTRGVAPAARAPDVATRSASGHALHPSRSQVQSRLAALAARGAAVWGGMEYRDAVARASEVERADQAGDAAEARRDLAEVEQLLDAVEQRAPRALNAELYAGERALEAGNRPMAHQAFELAYRIDPGNPSAERGLQRASVLDGVLPLLSDGLRAEAARKYSRAAQDYGQALALDPNNAGARAGLKRANAAWGGNTYAEAVSTGFGLLGAGRLDAAREAFTKALAINARGPDALEGLERVNAALRSRGLAELRTRAATLESEGRWGEALQDYDAALRLDPTLAFARQGSARATAHLEDTDQAGGVDLTSRAKTVHLALVSDNETEVEIQEIGSFGTFARRDIDLKPGRYTVIGTRAGYRAVRRDVTVAPGESAQTISVRCQEPI